ncbi:hypothetical protein [Ruegeria lacuscaerulensis]|uniref:hypothetical protein n=1 Tax=Ruegeria lacuscaerulensis TaxID=55218 RepID=UPI00147F8475|nr:hypothetical protein [Ruegeria lacuscaerulensis]
MPGLDEMLRPLMALFSKAKGTWYLHGIATDPDYFGRGFSSQIQICVGDLERFRGREYVPEEATSWRNDIRISTVCSVSGISMSEEKQATVDQKSSRHIHLKW